MMLTGGVSSVTVDVKEEKVTIISGRR